MRKLRFFSRLFLTFVNKFKFLLIGGVGLGIASFIVIPRVSFILSFFDKGERVAYVGRFSTQDLPYEIQQQISLGLTTLDEAGEANKALAESWESSDEGKVWIFKLGDYKWQDGTNVRAADINYQFSDVESKVLDDKTIRFNLKDPFSPFPVVVSKPVFKRGLVGAGEWKVERVSFVSGRFLGYLKMVRVSTGEKKTIKFYPSEEAARGAFKLGEVDTLTDLVDLRELGTWKNIKVTEVPKEDRYVGVFINTKDPIFQEKSLRQALAYAIDTDAFGEKRAISPISPNSWAFNPLVKQYKYNLARAKELLEGLPKEQREGLTISLVTTPSLLGVGDKIKEYWEAVGVKTHLQVSNTPPRDFQALLAIQIIPPDPDQYGFWHSTQTETNITNYRDSKESQRIDKLLEDGRRTLDKEDRKKYYLDFQRFLVEESPVLFLFHPKTYTISRK